MLFIYQLYQKPLRCFRKVFWIGLGSSILFAPWLVWIIPGKLGTVAVGILSTPANDVSPTVAALKKHRYLHISSSVGMASFTHHHWLGFMATEKGVGIISLW